MHIYKELAGNLMRYTCDSKQCWSRVNAPNGDPLYISASPSPDFLLIKKSNLGILGDKLLTLSAPHTLNFAGYMLGTLMASQQDKDKLEDIERGFVWSVPLDMIVYGVHLAIYTEIVLRAGSAVALRDFFHKHLVFYFTFFTQTAYDANSYFDVYKKIAVNSTVSATIQDKYNELGVPLRFPGFH